MKDQVASFLKVWYSIMYIGVIGMIALAIIVYLVYKMRVSALTDYKKKHDFINDKSTYTI